jgi:hypothetical protein
MGLPAITSRLVGKDLRNHASVFMDLKPIPGQVPKTPVEKNGVRASLSTHELPHEDRLCWLSWTIFFFGGIPTVFRGDFLGFVVWLVVAIALAFFTAAMRLEKWIATGSQRRLA